MRRFWMALAALSLPVVALADADKWRTISVDLTLLSDGSLAVVERATDLMPEDTTVIKRRYWNESDEHVKVLRVMRVEADGRETPQPFDVNSWGQIQIKVPPGGEGPKYFQYRVDSVVSGDVMPIWGIRRGVRRMDFPAVLPPIDRMKEIVALWREARPNRYFFDYQFFFADDQENPDVPVTFHAAGEWKPVRPILPAVVKTPTFGYADSVRVSAVLDYAGSVPPSTVDIRTHRIRMLSIAAFPLIAILIWLAYLGRRRKSAGAIDEQWLREHVLNEAPEVVAARWGSWPPLVFIEEFLRRLEREGKIALDIRTIDEGTDDEDRVVNVRLRVPRERLSEYERHVIDALMPDGRTEVDSRDIQTRHAGTDFDPMEGAQKYIHDLRDTARAGRRSPALSRLFSFALFAAGIFLIVVGIARNGGQEPVPLFATLIFLAPFVAFWPSKRASLTWVPIVLMCVFLAVVHSMTPQPLGVYASIGVLLALVGAYHAIAADAATGSKPADLAAAEAWLRAQPHPRSEWRPYLEALGIEKAKSKDVEGEDWGWTLETFTEKKK